MQTYSRRAIILFCFFKRDLRLISGYSCVGLLILFSTCILMDEGDLISNVSYNTNSSVKGII